MKTLISLFVASLSFSSAFSDQITATIVFENLTTNTAISGVFYIAETNQFLEINSLDTFTVELPEEGTYHFKFYSEDVSAYTTYPAMITGGKNTVTIRLENKSDDRSPIAVQTVLPLKDISGFSVAQLEEALEDGAVNFIIHGLIGLNAEEYKTFKDEYRVGFTSETCVVDPVSYKIAQDNNKKIESYLNSKFGHDWKDQLPAQPFGLSNSVAENKD